MAHIRKVKKSNGVVMYKAEIVLKKKGQIIHRESKTFPRQRLAKDWSIRREIELHEIEIYGKDEFIPVKNIIKQYLKDFPPTGRSKNFDLNKLMTFDIANIDVYRLSAKDLIKHIVQRNKKVSPQTANNDLVWLKVCIQTMRSVMGFEFDISIFYDARAILKQEGMIGRPVRRHRRPSKQELMELSRQFHGNWTLHVFWFAIFSGRRQAEIMLLRWDDINHDNKTIIVRNLKHPTIKKHQKRAKLPRSAYKLIMRQAKVSEFIFPYNPKTMSAYFTRACHILDIIDLRFHDLRHEAVSRMFEAGLSIVEVQQISLHSSWSSLSRYTNLDPGDIDI